MNKLIKSLLIFDAVLIGTAGAFGFLGFVTNGYEAVVPLYMKCDGKIINNALPIPAEGQTLTVQVKATGFNKTVSEYTVDITPNTERDFEYWADGSIYKFSEITSLTAAFEVHTYENQFTLKCLTMPELLSAYHNGAEIELSSETQAKVSYFQLTLGNATGSYRKTVGIRYEVELDDLDMDEEEIIFR